MGRGKRTDAGTCTKCLKVWPEDAVWCPTCGPPIFKETPDRVRPVGCTGLPLNLVLYVFRRHRRVLGKPHKVMWARAAEALNATKVKGTELGRTKSHKDWRDSAVDYLMARLRNGDWI